MTLCPNGERSGANERHLTRSGPTDSHDRGPNRSDGSWFEEGALTMDPSTLKLIYFGAIVLNTLALGYAVAAGATLYAVTFIFVLAYLGVRYRMLGGK